MSGLAFFLVCGLAGPFGAHCRVIESKEDACIFFKQYKQSGADLYLVQIMPDGQLGSIHMKDCEAKGTTFDDGKEKPKNKPLGTGMHQEQEKKK